MITFTILIKTTYVTTILNLFIYLFILSAHSLTLLVMNNSLRDKDL